MKTLGIVKETKNKWEQRVPLNPSAVKELIDKGFQVLVQPSNTRIYKNYEYENAGAILQDDLSQCDFIIGVKEIYNDQLISGKPHLYFSHVIKGQDYNMPMLQQILDDKITLFDYEKITDEKNRRLVFFGEYAGNAGMIDTLHGLGKRLKEQHGLDTPFLKVKHAFQYSSVDDAVEHIREIGKEIEKKGLPEEICALNVFLMGYGHVSHGSRKILEALPYEEVDPDELRSRQSELKNNKIYISTFKEKHMVNRKDGSVFDLQDYYTNPTLFKSKMEEYLDLCSIYINAIYWTPECPVFLPNSYLKEINNNPKLIIIGDITCDIEGSVQATLKSTMPDVPTFIFNPDSNNIKDGYKGNGFAVMAVDNLPCEFPKEASDSFSNALMPFMESILQNDYSKSIKDSSLPAEIKKACIAHQGKLEPDYEYLKEFIKN